MDWDQDLFSSFTWGPLSVFEGCESDGKNQDLPMFISINKHWLLEVLEF